MNNLGRIGLTKRKIPREKQIEINNIKRGGKSRKGWCLVQGKNDCQISIYNSQICVSKAAYLAHFFVSLSSPI